MRKCELTPGTRQLELVAPQRSAEGMRVQLRGREYRQVALGLRCEGYESGPITVVVETATGHRREIGPVAGPVRRAE